MFETLPGIPEKLAEKSLCRKFTFTRKSTTGYLKFLSNAADDGGEISGKNQ